MQEGRVSQTALRVATTMVTLGQLPRWRRRLPAGLAELSERAERIEDANDIKRLQRAFGYYFDNFDISMQNTNSRIDGNGVMFYFDDIVIVTETVEDAPNHIREVIDCLCEAGFKMSSENGDFMRTAIKYFETVVRERGILHGTGTYKLQSI